MLLLLILIMFLAVGEEPEKVSTPPATPLEVKETTNESGLTETQRKTIYLEVIQNDRKADKEAMEKYPLPYYKNLVKGERLTLEESIPLMPEFNPSDPMAALLATKDLTIGTVIEIISKEEEQSTVWYQINAISIGQGWINSIALMNQLFSKEQAQLLKQTVLATSLSERYEDEVAEKHNLAEEEFDKILLEGITKMWR